MPLSLLKSEITITGSPIGTDPDPNVTAPSSGQIFYSPLLSAGPQQLYAATVDGTSPYYILQPWWWDDSSSIQKWFQFPNMMQCSLLRQLTFSPYLFAPNAKLFLQVTYATGGTTKLIAGFGLGTVTI